MSNVNKINPFVKYYDKIAVVAVLMALGVSFYYLARAKHVGREIEDGMQSLRASEAVLDPVALKKYETAAKNSESPLQLTPPGNKSANFVTPELRAQCIARECRKPISLDATNCVFCGSAQPKKAVVAEVLDFDGDTIPDKWEVKYGMNPKDKADADADADQDGFTNLEEYLAKTDPSDASSHPPLIKYLALSEIRSKKLPFVFSAYNKMPDGFQLTLSKTVTSYGQSSIFAKTNSLLLAKKTGLDTDYRIAEFKYSREKRFNAAKGFNEYVDNSKVTVERIKDKKRFTLAVHDKKPVDTDLEAVVSFERGEKEFTVVENTKFKIRDNEFKVTSIDARAKTVGIENISTGEKAVLPLSGDK